MIGLVWACRLGPDWASPSQKIYIHRRNDDDQIKPETPLVLVVYRIILVLCRFESMWHLEYYKKEYLSRWLLPEKKAVDSPKRIPYHLLEDRALGGI